MNREDLKKYLLEKDFELLEDSSSELMLQNEHALIGWHENEISISFCHGDAGYYNIDNASDKQIVAAVELFAAAKFCPDTENGPLPKKLFKMMMLKSLTKFIEQE